MNTQPTPETDREDIIITKGKPTHWVSQEFARRLERERDEARAESIRWMSIAEGRGRTDDDEQLATVTAQRDRLAAVLQKIRDGYGGQVASPNCCADCDYLLPIDESLQSLTPNAEL
jgi:hypothetical protein